MPSSIIHEDENGDATVESMDAEIALYPCSTEEEEEEPGAAIQGTWDSGARNLEPPNMLVVLWIDIFSSQNI